MLKHSRLGITCSAIFLAFATFLSASRAEELHVRFVNAGQGDCIIAKLGDGRVLMVDCGSAGGASASTMRKGVMTMLDAQNPRVDILVITHPDTDHYNRIPTVLKNVTVGTVYMVGSVDDYPVSKMRDWLEARPARSIKPLRARTWNKPAPRKIASGGGTTVYVLAADVEDETVGSEKNTRSVVLKLTHGEFDLILTGDGTFDTEADILQRLGADTAFMDVEMLKVGHHGSRRTSTSPEWLTSVKPEWAILTAGYRNRHSHPEAEVVNRLADYATNAPPHKLRWTWRTPNNKARYTNSVTFAKAIYSTATSGNIDVVSDGSAVPRITCAK